MSNSGVASLLIILGEPHYDTQIRPVLDRILEGLTVWDQSKSTVDLNTELLNFINKNVTPEKVEGGTILRSEGKVYIEILVHPTIALLTQWLQNFLYQPTSYKLIIHAGPVFQGTGSWILRDGTFSLHDFARFIHKNEIASVLKERGDTPSTTTISCINEGEWNDNGFKLHELNKRYSIHVQQKGVSGDLQCTNNVLSYFNRYITYCDLTELMPSSNIVGSVRFRRPTIYMFPAGQGDAALFGVSGFTLLMDGGYQWKSCFWDFLRHVDRIDAMLISRLNAGTISGARSFVKRLSMEPETHPKLGYAFMNAPTRQAVAAAVSSPQGNPLLVSVFDQTFDVVDSLAKLSLEPHPLAFSINPATKHLEPLTLYQKVGHGRLEMYVLNPARDSKELQEFTTNFKRFSLTHFNSSNQSSFSVKPNAPVAHGAYPVPGSAQLSVAALIVWHPANAQENVIRVLYPGSCPQDRLLASLDKLKHLEFLKHSACTPASLESGRGVKGTPVRKPAESNAKLLSPTPKPSHNTAAATNHQQHPITGTNLVRTSPAPPAHQQPSPVPAPQLSPVVRADHHQHNDALLVDTQPSPQPKVDAVSKSPKVETFLEASAPFMAANVEHSMPAEVLEKHGMSAAAPSIPPQHNDHGNIVENFHDHHEAVDTTSGKPHRDHYEEIHERGFIQHNNEPYLLKDEGESSVHRAGCAIPNLIDSTLDHQRHDPNVAVCPAAKHDLFEPQHEKPLLQPMDAQPLLRTEDNTSDAASPLSPVNSEEIRVKESPVDPIQRPLLDLDSADFATHDTSSTSGGGDMFDHQHQHHLQQQHSPLEPSSSPDLGVERRPHSATRLNPDAPEFVPRHSIGSDDAAGDVLEAFNQQSKASPHSPSLHSPIDPPATGISNGVSHAVDVPHPDVPGAVGEDHHHVEKRSLEDMMKNFDGQMPGEDIPEDLLKAWGKPLGAPPPPGVAKSMTSSSSTTTAAAAKKPAASSTAAAASSKDSAAAKQKPTATSGAAASKKPSAASTSSKQANGTDSKQSSAAAKKPTTTAAAAHKPSGQSPAASSKSTTSTTTAAAAAATAAKTAKAPPPAKSTGAAAAALTKPKPSSATSSPASTKTAPPKQAAATTAKTAAPSSAKKPSAAISGPSYYIDLTYVPHNGNPHFVNADFFKAVRAKYYVLSSLQAPKETLEAFLQGKKAWNLPEEEVTLIPTYDSDALNLWMSVHRDDLTVESIDVAPSCARCSLNLEEHHGTVCAAYRLEL